MFPNDFASKIFSSLSRNHRPWYLSRILQSGNRFDMQGELKGTATFKENDDGDLVYEEMGNIGSTAGNMAGLTWSRKYVWRLSTLEDKNIFSSPDTNNDMGLSIWFAKLPQKSLGLFGSEADESDTKADYVFHRLKFLKDPMATEDTGLDNSNASKLQPLIPPHVADSPTRVVVAHGRHLCVNDTYETTYAFRVSDDDLLHVISWASRHVIHGPKKDQDIINMYRRCDEA